jgi:dTDP-4-amino-4,6-dideoxygalactose transaminase
LLLRDLRRLPLADVDAGLHVMQLLSRTSRWLRGIKPTEAHDNPFFELDRDNFRMPALSQWILRRSAAARVVERRRRNFDALLRITAANRRAAPLLPRLINGACPSYFPVVIPDGAAAFARHCQHWGVQAFRTWRHMHPQFPQEQFPEGCWLKQYVATLPVHQDLNPAELDQIERAIVSWEQGG